jgi:hypothetical protein
LLLDSSQIVADLLEKVKTELTANDITFEVHPEDTSVVSLLDVQAAKETELSFYFVNLAAVVRKFEEWQRHLPRVKPYYGMRKPTQRSPSTPSVKRLTAAATTTTTTIICISLPLEPIHIHQPTAPQLHHTTCNHRRRAVLILVSSTLAVKCNPDPAIVRTLNAIGTGFDCASIGEMHQILGIGVAAERIIYANPCKQKSMYRAVAVT